MTIPFVDLTISLSQIRLSIDAAIWRVMDRGIFLNGPEVEAFESEWASYCGQRFCVACASGTDALMLAVQGHCILEVRVQANACPFTATGVEKTGVNLRFNDCTSDGPMAGLSLTPCMAPDSGYDIPLLLYGRHPSGRELSHWDSSRPLLIDACQGHGWKPPAKVTAAWSFYPTKNLGCFGDGGAMTTNSEKAAERAREIAADWHSRMSEINAAVLRTKLPHLDRWNAERAAIAEVYYNELPDWAEPACRPGEPTNHHIFAVLVDRRDELEGYLLKNGIGVKVHYREPLADLPGAKRWCSRTLSLPCYSGLTPMQVQAVCDTIRSFK